MSERRGSDPGYAEYNPGDHATIYEVAPVTELMARRVGQPVVSKTGQVVFVTLPGEDRHAVAKRWRILADYPGAAELSTETVSPATQFQEELHLGLQAEFRRIFGDRLSIDWQRERVISRFTLGGTDVPERLKGLGIIMSSDAALIKHGSQRPGHADDDKRRARITSYSTLSSIAPIDSTFTVNGRVPEEPLDSFLGRIGGGPYTDLGADYREPLLLTLHDVPSMY